MKYQGTKELTYDVFNGQPAQVDWVGVDFDGLMQFGVARAPRFTWASERWRGFVLVGLPISNSGYKPLTSLKREEIFWAFDELIEEIKPDWGEWAINGIDTSGKKYHAKTQTFLNNPELEDIYDIELNTD